MFEAMRNNGNGLAFMDMTELKDLVKVLEENSKGLKERIPFLTKKKATESNRDRRRKIISVVGERSGCNKRKEAIELALGFMQ
ncbi:hypothetical protein GIB67_029494 [Kingdonia uniflora]|uniref:Uncharacterized protein n=1 Tax=Kingdonia uniflora TaxID=39325 RepID=A0A7J7NY02_9MAGN|nr:hypothetical protein GIB67_029494 [Kingdonia uniflora]